VFESVRGQGFAAGHQNESAQLPISSLRARDNGLIVVGAGENVVRAGAAAHHHQGTRRREGCREAGKDRRGDGSAEKAAAQMNAPLKAKPKHFLDLSDHDSATLKALIADARRRKAGAHRPSQKGVADPDRPLDGKVLAMIFDKQSTRTRLFLRCRGPPAWRHHHQ